MNKLLMTLLCAAALTLTACRSVNPTTGQKEFDPVKTQAVKDTVQPLAAGAVRRVIQNSPQHSDAIAEYFRSIGTAFCKMDATGNFSPQVLVDAADAATAKLQAGVDPYVIDLKNGIVALYKLNFGARFNAELSPERWPAFVASVFCNGIGQGLKDAGKPGIASAPQQPQPAT